MNKISSELKTKVLKISDSSDFNAIALSIFKHQYKYNHVYRDFVDALNKKTEQIHHYSQIPFLPISFYKTREVVCNYVQPLVVFESSGTTGQNNSKHAIEDLSFYNEVSASIFNSRFGSFQNKLIIGLLPSYLERQNSSLVFMVNHFIEQSKHPDSGFYLNNTSELYNKLLLLKNSNFDVILFGVTFALLDFCKEFSIDFPALKIIETGGMKGRGKELIREELHLILKKGFGVEHIYSEYGMTELLSQAYSIDNKGFIPPKWMKILVRETNDPLCVKEFGKGIINVIDLSNVDSCSFIATDDLGQIFDENIFDVEGRVDYSEIRGCSLLSL